MVTSPKPKEQVRFTNDTTDYLWYSTTVTAQKAGRVVLQVPARDVVYAYVNGNAIYVLPISILKVNIKEWVFLLIAFPFLFTYQLDLPPCLFFPKPLDLLTSASTMNL